MADKSKKEGMIYYTPVTHRRLTARDLYPLVYGNFLHKAFASLGEEKPAYYDLILCKNNQKEILKKKLYTLLGIRFEELHLPLDKETRHDFVNRLMKELFKRRLPRKGLIKGYFCPGCGRVLEGYEVRITRERHHVYSLRMNVTALADPLTFSVTDPLALLNVKAIGVRNMEKYADKKGIVPILGHHVPILKVEDVSRPEYYTRFITLQKEDKEDEESESRTRLLSLYRNDPERLLGDLSMYGALSQSLDQEIEVPRCRHCNEVADNLLAEHLFISEEGVEQVTSERPRSGPLILTSHKGWPDSHPGPVRIEYRICPQCKTLFYDEKSCPACSKVTHKEEALFNDRMRNLLLPFLWRQPVRFLLLHEEEKDFVSDRLSFFQKILAPRQKGDNRKVIGLEYREGSGEGVLPESFPEVSPLAYLDGALHRDIHLSDRKVLSFLNRWERLFSRRIKGAMDEVDIRTDFYIDKLLLTALEDFILKATGSLEVGDLFSFLGHLEALMGLLDHRVYPFVKKIQAEEDPAVFRNSLYVFRAVKTCLAPFYPDISESGRIPAYREDYHFSEELERDHFILDLIDTVMDGKSILNIGPDEPLEIWITNPGGGLEDTLNRNMFYITRFLSLTELKYITPKEMPKKSLKMKLDKISLYIPVYDKSRVSLRMEELQQQKEEINRRILEKRSRLFDFEFLNKASPQVIEAEEENLRALLVAKEKMKGYIKLLAQLEREGRDGGTKPVQKTP
ncbi:hypothetical protein JXR74_07945 [Candidatus Mcinerneyibacteriota bacterium]|nr:hypothetical protein [Candidatus Mcinerneyibacteriota bacterium]